MVERLPRNLPTGVLIGETMAARFIGVSFEVAGKSVPRDRRWVKGGGAERKVYHRDTEDTEGRR
jgi:hypothetical protein